MSVIVPPVRFEWVESSLMRGATPRLVNYPFLKKTGVKKLVSVCNKDPFEGDEEDEDCELVKFCNELGIEMVHIDVHQSSKTKGKNRSVGISHLQVDETLQVLLNSNEGGRGITTTMVFCDTGGATTSILIGCLRKVEMWSSISIAEEFSCFMGTISHLERTFLEEYTPKFKIYRLFKVEWLWHGVNESLIRGHPLLKNLLLDNQETNLS